MFSLYSGFFLPHGSPFRRCTKGVLDVLRDAPYDYYIGDITKFILGRYKAMQTKACGMVLSVSLERGMQILVRFRQVTRNVILDFNRKSSDYIRTLTAHLVGVLNNQAAHLILPLLKKLSSIFLSHLLRFCCCGGFRLLIPLSNLFCSPGPLAQLTLYRSKGWVKVTKLNPAGLYAYEEVRSSFHHKRYPPLRRMFAAVTFSLQRNLLLRCFFAAR